MGGKHMFIERALELARKSEHNKFKHGAVIVKGTKVISEAPNKYFSNVPVPGVSSIHAEHNAIKSSRRSVKGCDIYIARYASYGAAMSKPCERCQIILRNMGIRKAFYTNSCGIIMESMNIN